MKRNVATRREKESHEIAEDVEEMEEQTSTISRLYRGAEPLLGEGSSSSLHSFGHSTSSTAALPKLLQPTAIRRPPNLSRLRSLNAASSTPPTTPSTSLSTFIDRFQSDDDSEEKIKRLQREKKNANGQLGCLKHKRN